MTKASEINNHGALRRWSGVFGACLLLVGIQRAGAQVVPPAQAAPSVQPVPQQLETGPVFDVIPYVLSDGHTINLTLIPTITEFVGYDDPNAELPPSGSLAGNVTLVPTVLPRYRVRQVTTTVNVWDGQTVVLGGMLSESIKKTRDKVPVLGDVPLLGRFFRSEQNQTEKKNLLIFVTPTIVDPAGNRYNGDDEQPFAPGAAATRTAPAGQPKS